MLALPVSDLSICRFSRPPSAEGREKLCLLFRVGAGELLTCRYVDVGRWDAVWAQLALRTVRAEDHRRAIPRERCSRFVRRAVDDRTQVDGRQPRVGCALAHRRPDVLPAKATPVRVEDDLQAVVANVRPEVAELGIEVRSKLCRAEVCTEVDVRVTRRANVLIETAGARAREVEDLMTYLVLEKRGARLIGRAIDLAAEVLRLLPNAILETRHIDVATAAATRSLADEEKSVPAHRRGAEVIGRAIDGCAEVLGRAPRAICALAARYPDILPSEGAGPVRSYEKARAVGRLDRAAVVEWRVKFRTRAGDQFRVDGRTPFAEALGGRERSKN
jgi:hypothetical protein